MKSSSSNFAQKQFLEFDEAQKVVKELGIQNGNQYKILYKAGKLPGMPSHPGEFYSKEYKPGKMPFKEAREIVHKLNIKGYQEYKKTKLPTGIPKTPHKAYEKDGWIDWFDWLGKPGKRYQSSKIPYKEAQTLVRKLGIKKSTDYHKLKKQRKLPNELPFSPEITYIKQGWIDWYDYLGVGKTTQRNLLPIEEAKKIVKKLKLIEWKDYKKAYENNKLPKGLPFSPKKSYEKLGYKDWDDFVGNIKIPFEEAKKIVKKYKIKSSMQYFKYLRSNKLPKGMSYDPHRTYKEWIDWFDFCGKEKKHYVDYEEAKNIARKLKIKTFEQYRKCIRAGKLEGLPFSPDQHYRGKGWQYWYVFLGTKPSPNKVRVRYDFDEAKVIARKLKIKNRNDYVKLYQSSKLPKGMPANPDVHYRRKF